MGRFPGTALALLELALLASALPGLVLAAEPDGGVGQAGEADQATVAQPPAGGAPRAATAPRMRPGAPGRDGIVVAVRGETVYVDLGRGDGVAVGQRLRVVRPGAPLVHPVTGETLGTADEPIARLEVTAVAERFAATRVLQLASGATIEPRDRVVAAADEGGAPAPRAARPAGGPGQALREGPGPGAPGGADGGPSARAPAAQVPAAAGRALDPSRPTVSQELDSEVRDLAVADLDGDGRPELVTIDQVHFAVYRWTGTSLERLFEQDAEKGRDYISVDAADLDGDGRAELLVNDAAPRRGQAVILQYDGGRFVRYDLPGGRYFRIIGAEVGAPILVGQQRGGGGLRVEMGGVGNIYRYDPTGSGRIAARTRPAESAFVDDVYGYEWRGGRARRGEALWTPAGASILDIQLYRAAGGTIELAAGSPAGRLHLFRGQEEVWSSQQGLAGRGRIVPLDGVTGDRGEPVPALVVRRDAPDSSADARVGFGEGALVALAVDGPAARELWRTEPFEGAVAAYRIADLGAVSGGVGGRAVVVALEPRKGRVERGRSVIVVQPLR